MIKQYLKRLSWCLIIVLTLGWKGITLAEEKTDVNESKKNNAAVIVATDYPSIQAAIDALPPNGGTVFIPSGDYTITKTINLTGRNTRNITEEYPKSLAWVKIEGAGKSTKLIGATGGQPVFDLTDSQYCEISNLRIVGSDCNVGILLARNKTAGSAGDHIFYGLLMDGSYTVAAVYSFASEINRYVNCNFYNGVDNASTFIVTCKNIANIKSQYAGELTESSNTVLHFFGCSIGAFGGGDSIGLHVISHNSDISMDGSYIASAGLAGIVLDGTLGAISNVRITGVRIEAERAKHCLLAKGNVSSVSIEGGAWICSRGAPVAYENADKNSAGCAWDWSIRGVRFNLWPGFVAGTVDSGDYVIARFDGIKQSEIRIISPSVLKFLRDEKGNQTGVAGVENFTTIKVAGFCVGNQFTVRQKKEVVLEGTPEYIGKNTIIGVEE